MSADQINKLRDTFRIAMLDWDVAVSVTIDEDTANVFFELWNSKIEGCFFLQDGRWANDRDCPHFITGQVSAWQWIAMKLYDKLPYALR